MFSPHDSPAVNDWFRRLETAWRRLPAEERASQREEIQQHLEGLVAANIALGQLPDDAWEAALKQFGDPTRIGRKMYQEWQQGRVGFRADMKAILFSVGITWLWSIVIPLLSMARIFWLNAHGLLPLSAANYHLLDLPRFVHQVVGYGGTLVVSTIIGRRYPMQAIKGAFYGALLWGLVNCLQIVVFSYLNPKMILPQPLPTMLLHNAPFMLVVASLHAAIAFLASVTKRGWYRPTWADFTLTLPRKRLHLGR